MNFQFYWLIRLLNVELFLLVIVKIGWDPKNVRSSIIGWFIVKAWRWPSRFETCCQYNHNKLVVFDGNILLLIISSENTSGWLPSNLTISFIPIEVDSFIVTSFSLCQYNAERSWAVAELIASQLLKNSPPLRKHTKSHYRIYKRHKTSHKNHLLHFAT